MDPRKIDRQQVEDVISLSTMQEGILFHYLSNPDTEEYFSQLSLTLTGQLETDILKKAWNWVIAHNEMLRALYRWEDIKKPVQIILKEQPLCLKEYDLTAIPAAEQPEKMEEIKALERRERFDLEAGPLFRVSLLRLAPDRAEMILNNHHILYDGWSMGTLLQEFFAAYHHYLRGVTPLKVGKTHFREYLHWLQQQEKEAQERFWRRYLQDYQTPTGLPIDHPRQGSSTTAANALFRLPDGLTRELEETAKALKVTVSSMFNAAWGILLQKYNNQNQAIFGITVSGRTPEVPGMEEMVGLFINTVPAIVRTDARNLLREVIQTVHAEAQARKSYEQTPLVDIKTYSEMNSRDNLFDSIVVIENFTFFEELRKADHALRVEAYSSFEMPNFDLTVEVVLLREIEVNFIYRPDLFDRETIEGLHTHLVQILKAMAAHPDDRVAEVEMLSAAERERLLFEFNDTAQAYEKNKTIFRLFEEQAERTPERIALEYEGETLTYGELNRKANRLARYLRRYGVKAGSVTGVMMERSFDLVVSLLAVMKTGAAYLPIAFDYPAERVTYMLNDARADVLLTHHEVMERFSYTALQNFEAHTDIRICVTGTREHIREFDQLPMPDRSLLDLRNYRNKIGMASVNNCISLQTTRGCPYKCLYCHKIWSKHHVHRSAENIFDEIRYYYDNGVRNFAIIDDCFNLDMQNSSRLFRMILQHGLDLQIFFPNGLRGDILTPEYIDLMVEAGTRGINLSLETASPRLQKLLMKNLDLDRFKMVVDYIATRHPEIILEMATMHGFPTETEEEAMMTLNFIKDIKWLHFPYIHILKVFPNTEMEAFALAHGVAKEDILISKDRAFHELPETLPFPKAFTRRYQGEFLNEYFLNRERLRKVLPVQMRILDESALIQKYNAYLPVEIKTIQDLLRFTGIEDLEIPAELAHSGGENHAAAPEVPSPVTIFDRPPVKREPQPGARRILLLDLSQHFSSHSMLYKVAEQPIGLICLLTYLNQQYGDRIHGRIYKSGNDFDSFEELKAIIDEYKPDLVGIRTLTFFKEFFHETVALLRQWGLTSPVITGGPYASSDFDTILRDRNVDLVVFGEGEYTMAEVVDVLLRNDFRLPSAEQLRDIPGIAFVEEEPVRKSREVLTLDRIADCLSAEADDNLNLPLSADLLAYVMYTSGTTGRPKGIMVEHRNVNNCVDWMQSRYPLEADHVVVQRTNLTFDPSVWEIFWPLYRGARVLLLTTGQGKDADFLIQLLTDNTRLTMMYCPASMVTGMTYLLQARANAGKLRLPWFFIGAEPISMDVVRNFYRYFDGRLVNTYGPTECTINNTYYELNPGEERSVVPIGRPVANNQIYILSGDLQLMPVKIPGEICIAGDSVARGYIHNPEKTGENFIANPFGPGLLYRTGDVGRWLPDGTIEIMGRVDHQVKIRGYRMELGEIEAALLRHRAVRSCAVIVRDSRADRDAVQTCKRCGITTAYADVKINEDGFCSVCENAGSDLAHAEAYFKTPEALAELIRTQSAKGTGEYDCILLYAGGRGAGYALYQLAEMGVKVLALTFDNGFFSTADLENIRRITAKLEVDHVVLTHPQTEAILRDSIATASTVCKGCFLASSALAVEYARTHGIRLVIGATLSRGQIIENKLYKFYRQGIYDVREIERELLHIQKQTHALEETIYGLLDIDSVKEGSVYDEVVMADFYRYYDIGNAAMIQYLNGRDSYWASRKNFAIYSTNCPIKQIGDYCHLQERGYHYYGSATSWEKRLGHITLENLREDLQCHVTPQALENFLRKIEYAKEDVTEKLETKYLAAYYEADEELPIAGLRDHLLMSIPEYMIPTYFTRMEAMPLDTNGKIDRKALPRPAQVLETGTRYVAPRNEIEAELVQVWQKLLKVERVGIQDSFFALGGNSLSIIKLNGEVNKVLDHEVKLMDLFKYHTIAMFMEFYQSKYGAVGAEAEVAVSVESVLERFQRGEISMEEADRLILELNPS